MFAVFESGGKQHRVQEGDVVRLERLAAEPGTAVEFDRVLMVGNADAGVTVGRPFVDGGRVTAEVLEHGRGDRIRVMKFKRRKDYQRKHGHRQYYTAVRITGIAR